ncbi:uncharacterized protein METZ01_LOCUS261454 [marine metagenome]|uniref:TnsA endonuclease N-terminal domain-containing protein n=1 Tax=marine metagenome TaxID=408172 RepID=A0A382J937_9ZZZZ
MRKVRPYKGKYKIKNPKKYVGNKKNVIYRSLWERKFMLYCDKTDAILEWSSEELAIPYMSPVDNKMHRYYPDFYIKMIDIRGNIREKIIEIKPKFQTREPKNTHSSVYNRWLINDAKWRSAMKHCHAHKQEFRVLTEDHLF